MTIRELSEITGVSADTLRYYERAGLMTPVGRGPNGHRSYEKHHVFWVAFLRRLRATGMSIGELRDYTGLVRAGEATLVRRIALLSAHRTGLGRKLAELQDSLDLLEVKIAFYEEQRHGSGPVDLQAHLRRNGRAMDGSRCAGRADGSPGTV